MSAPCTVLTPAPRGSRLASAVVVLFVALTGLIGFAPPATAAGATVTGRFVTDAGVPVDGVRAVLVQNASVVYEATSAADGTFEITGIAPGNYFLDGSDVFETYSSVSVVELTLAEGETRALGDLELYDSSWVSPNTRLTGYVRDPSGKPVRGIQVLARTATPLQADSVVGGFGVTNRSGRFTIDSDGAGGLPVEGTYKLAFTDRLLLDETFIYSPRYSGDQPTWARATTVTIDSTMHTVGDVTVTRNGGISGNVTGTVPMTNGTVTVYDADGDQVASKVAGVGGAYAISTLRPGSYFLRFSSTDSLPGGGAKFIRTFWPGASSLLGAKPVVVKSGVFKSGINQTLSDQLTAFRQPSISGRARVGSKLTASPGSWSLTVGTEYSYEWLRGTTVVGTARTYRPVKADVGKVLRVRVSARCFDRSGTATSAKTGKVKP